MMLGKWDIHTAKERIWISTSHHIEKNPKWIEGPNIRAKSRKLLEKNS